MVQQRLSSLECQRLSLHSHPVLDPPLPLEPPFQLEQKAAEDASNGSGTSIFLSTTDSGKAPTFHFGI